MIAYIDLTTNEILAVSTTGEPNNVTSFECPDYLDIAKYNYVPSIQGVYDPNGFVLKPITSNYSREKRQQNIDAMNSYMQSFVLSGELTEAGFNKFLSETATNAFGYINGGNRLITWIDTINDGNYNASNSGFKTDQDYRGEQINNEYPRAEIILQILNNL